MTAAQAFAPAKVNLHLHVGPPDAAGYHPVCSLMAFADVGDTLTMTPADRLSLEVRGRFAAALQGGEADNLVLRAVRALAERLGRPEPAVRLVLDKALPVASGLGGGSSDAGAALRLARTLPGYEADGTTLEEVAAALGSDGAACLWARPVVAEGRGERLSPAPALPPLHAVLVNPGVACPTGAVYRAYDAAVHPAGADRPDFPSAFPDAASLAVALGACRNDLEPPAAALVPEVAETLAKLRAEPEPLLVRLSGSGATVFALVSDAAAGELLVQRVRTKRPDWWAAPCRLG